MAWVDQADGSPGDHVAACHGLSGRRIEHTYEKNMFPDSDSQGLVGGGAGKFLAGGQRMKGTEEVGSLSVDKLNSVAALMVDFVDMNKTYKMRLRDTERLN